MNIKRSVRMSMFLLPALFCCATTGREREAIQGSPDLQLEVNEVHFPVFFEDQTLTDDERKAIVADCQFLLEQLAPQGRRPLEARLIQQDDRSVRITNALLYSAKNYRRPRATRNQLGIIGRLNDDQESFVIQKKLSDDYKAAMALEAAHQQACRSLPGFIVLLNNLTETQLPPVKDFFYLHGQIKKRSDEFASAPKQEIIEVYGGFRYTCTSMLELRILEGRLATIVHAMNNDDGHLYERPVIYDDGRWKVIIARPGT